MDRKIALKIIIKIKKTEKRENISSKRKEKRRKQSKRNEEQRNALDRCLKYC